MQFDESEQGWEEWYGKTNLTNLNDGIGNLASSNDGIGNLGPNPLATTTFGNGAFVFHQPDLILQNGGNNASGANNSGGGNNALSSSGGNNNTGGGAALSAGLTTTAGLLSSKNSSQNSLNSSEYEEYFRANRSFVSFPSVSSLGNLTELAAENAQLGTTSGQLVSLTSANLQQNLVAQQHVHQQQQQHLVHAQGAHALVAQQQLERDVQRQLENNLFAQRQLQSAHLQSQIESEHQSQGFQNNGSPPNTNSSDSSGFTPGNSRQNTTKTSDPNLITLINALGGGITLVPSNNTSGGHGHSNFYGGHQHSNSVVGNSLLGPVPGPVPGPVGTVLHPFPSSGNVIHNANVGSANSNYVCLVDPQSGRQLLVTPNAPKELYDPYSGGHYKLVNEEKAHPNNNRREHANGNGNIKSVGNGNVKNGNGNVKSVGNGNVKNGNGNVKSVGNGNAKNGNGNVEGNGNSSRNGRNKRNGQSMKQDIKNDRKGNLWCSIGPKNGSNPPNLSSNLSGAYVVDGIKADAIMNLISGGGPIGGLATNQLQDGVLATNQLQNGVVQNGSAQNGDKQNGTGQKKNTRRRNNKSAQNGRQQHGNAQQQQQNGGQNQQQQLHQQLQLKIQQQLQNGATNQQSRQMKQTNRQQNRQRGNGQIPNFDVGSQIPNRRHQESNGLNFFSKSSSSSSVSSSVGTMFDLKSMNDMNRIDMNGNRIVYMKKPNAVNKIVVNNLKNGAGRNRNNGRNNGGIIMGECNDTITGGRNEKNGMNQHNTTGTMNSRQKQGVSKQSVISLERHRQINSYMDILLNENSTDADKNTVLLGVIPDLQKTCYCKEGHVLIQTLFETLTEKHQLKILGEQLVGGILKLSLHVNGCRVIQTALNYLDLSQQLLLVGELKGSELKCITDSHGNHVIQKIITTLPNEKLQFIIDTICSTDNGPDEGILKRSSSVVALSAALIADGENYSLSASHDTMDANGVSASVSMSQYEDEGSNASSMSESTKDSKRDILSLIVNAGIGGGFAGNPSQHLPLKRETNTTSSLKPGKNETTGNKNGTTGEKGKTSGESVTPGGKNILISTSHSDRYETLVRISNNIFGCRVMQRLLENCNVRQLDQLLKGIIAVQDVLLTNQYGNFVIQHSLKYATGEVLSKYRKNLLAYLESNIGISQHKYGSNALEKAFEYCTPDEIESLFKTILGENLPFHPTLSLAQTVSASTSHNVNPYSSFNGTNSSMMGGDSQVNSTIAAPTTNPYSMLNETANNSEPTNPGFNPPTPSMKSNPYSALNGSMNYETHQGMKKETHQGSESIIKGSTSDAPPLHLDPNNIAFLNFLPLASMMRDRYGNYVVQKMLQYADPETQQPRLVKILKKFALKRFGPYGRYTLATLNKIEKKKVEMQRNKTSREVADASDRLGDNSVLDTRDSKNKANTDETKDHGIGTAETKPVQSDQELNPPLSEQEPEESGHEPEAEKSCKSGEEEKESEEAKSQTVEESPADDFEPEKAQKKAEKNARDALENGNGAAVLENDENDENGNDGNRENDESKENAKPIDKNCTVGDSEWKVVSSKRSKNDGGKKSRTNSANLIQDLVNLKMQ